MSAIINFLRKNPGIFFNLIFSFASWLYGLFLRREILGYAASLDPKLENPSANYTVGVVLLLAILSETIGMFYKTRDMRFRLSQSDGASFETPLEGTGVMVLTAILHIVGVFILGAVMISAFGMNFEDYGWMVFLALFIRELYVWYLGFLSTSERSPDYQPVGVLKKSIGNACLVFWGLVAYTVVWERFAVNFIGYFQRGGFFSSATSAFQFFFATVGVILLSVVLFVPTRFGFILEETTFMKDRKAKMYFAASLALAVASAILPYVVV